jgi:hypothetical protein
MCSACNSNKRADVPKDTSACCTFSAQAHGCPLEDAVTKPERYGIVVFAMCNLLTAVVERWQALLGDALGIAWAQNCYKVMLLTGSKEAATLRFYEQAGFRCDGKIGLIAYPGDPAP